MKHILFVDDEPHFLDALRACLHGKQYKWAMGFSDSGGAAVAELQRIPYDLIVSDVRMSGMDGARLLRTVAERWPETVRVALSEHSDADQTMRLVSIAHQVLSKPCEPQALVSLIDRCFALQDLLRAPQLRAAVGRMRPLPPLRGVFRKLQSLLENPDVGVRDVAQLVGSDTVIAAKVLQMVNSAFFRASRRITSIEQAVTHLGFATLRTLVRSAEVFAAWPEKAGASTVSLERLQEHSQQVVAIAHALTSTATRPQAFRAAGEFAPPMSPPGLADDSMLAALVHDLGYWVLAHECPHELERARQRALTHNVPMHEAERDTFGATHAELGAYLLGIWGFPYSVVEAVAYHHTPAQVQQTSFDVLAVLAIAHALAPTHDADAFDGILAPDVDIDETYLGAVHAPFTWHDAVARAGHTMPQSPDARHPRAL
jgi:HD-like signal output (HDOD) protein/ActR/RegA family two-component response regulator